MTTVQEAQRKVDAIDKRIDAVRAELHRVVGIDPESFVLDTQEGRFAAAGVYHLAWGANPALHAIERSLFSRRYDAVVIRDGLLRREARAAERKALREFQKADAKRRAICPTCGNSYREAA